MERKNNCKTVIFTNCKYQTVCTLEFDQNNNCFNPNCVSTYKSTKMCCLLSGFILYDLQLLWS